MFYGSRIERLTHSLGVRLSLWYASGLAVGFLALILFTLYLTARSMEQSYRAAVLAEYQEDVARYQEIGERSFREEVLREPPDPDTQLLRLSEPDGDTLLLRPASGQSAASAQRMEQRLQADRRTGWLRLRVPHEGTWQVFSQPLPDGRWLQLAKSDARERKWLKSLRASLLTAAALFALLALGGGAALTARALRPIRQLIETTRTVIGSGDLAARVPMRGAADTEGRGDELDELSRLFNRMLARNEQSIRAMREALDNVAHELRTPLTRMRTGAEFALQRAGTSLSARDEALADAIEESERVLRILQSLMDIAEAEQGVLPLRLESVELTALVSGATDLYESVAEEKSIRLVVQAPALLWVIGDRVRLQQALANLLDNAIKYSPPGSEVQIRAERVGEREARITVCDEGIGIGVDELPRIWDRLYRADKSRTGQRGLGLGLSFVKAIVEGHGGRVEAKSRQLSGGTEVGFLLPMLLDIESEFFSGSQSPY